MSRFESYCQHQSFALIAQLVEYLFCNQDVPCSNHGEGTSNISDWESLANPSALGAEDRRFESFIRDQNLGGVVLMGTHLVCNQKLRVRFSPSPPYNVSVAKRPGRWLQISQDKFDSCRWLQFWFVRIEVITADCLSAYGGSIPPQTAKLLSSSRGLGHDPFTVGTPVRIRLRAPVTIAGRVRSPAGSHKPLPSLVQIQALQPNNSAVAQLVERKTVNFDVRGSSPRCGASNNGR